MLRHVTNYRVAHPRATARKLRRDFATLERKSWKVDTVARISHFYQFFAKYLRVLSQFGVLIKRKQIGLVSTSSVIESFDHRRKHESRWVGRRSGLEQTLVMFRKHTASWEISVQHILYQYATFKMMVAQNVALLVRSAFTNQYDSRDRKSVDRLGA